MPSPEAEFIGQLSRSQIYRDYEQAFSLATELPLTLRPVEIWSLAHKGKPHENPFCSLMAESNKGCAACLEVQEKIGSHQSTATTSTTCFAGLHDTAVPVRVGQQLIGFLQTGQVALKPPTAKKFQQITQKL